MADNKAFYSSSNTISCTLASLGSSATWVAGQSTAEIDNSSSLNLDRPVSGQITVGTSPTSGTVIEIWLIPKLADGNYADVFDGTDKAITVTSRGVLISYGILLSTILVDSTTSNRSYYFWSSISSKIGTLPPKKYQLFITHNTGVALNSTGGNHVIYETPEYVTTG